MSRKKPNIVVVLADQMSAGMLGCAGNAFVRTPALDGLAAEGQRFERVYCTNPVCIPSRFSLFTGRMPSEILLRRNDTSHFDEVPPHIRARGMGRLLAQAGYETAWGGKVHLPEMQPPDVGFERIVSADQRMELAHACADFVRAPHDRPFLLVASFVNPHDICYMAIRDRPDERRQRMLERAVKELAALDAALERPAGVGEELFFARHCPPLPANFEVPPEEPELVAESVANSLFRRHARENWPAERWRLHRWAYARLTERVDAEIGVLLDALRGAGRADDTLVIFTSDHGDHDGAHRLEHKGTFYEEAIRVPLIVRPPGGRAPAVDGAHLVSNGLDLLPTVCDYAGVEAPAELRGRSLRALVEDGSAGSWRDALPVECHLGNAIVTADHKYMLYDSGARREQLTDLRADPGDMRNAIDDPDKARTTAALRKRFAELHNDRRRILTE